jgi:hypothetical protein
MQQKPTIVSASICQHLATIPVKVYSTPDK